MQPGGDFGTWPPDSGARVPRRTLTVPQAAAAGAVATVNDTLAHTSSYDPYAELKGLVLKF